MQLGSILLISVNMKLNCQVGLSGIWTHNYWIPFRRSNRLSYQAMSLTRTQSQLCTATPISSFVQCQVSFRLLLSSAATFIYECLLYQCHTYINKSRRYFLQISDISILTNFQRTDWIFNGLIYLLHFVYTYIIYYYLYYFMAYLNDTALYAA